MNNNGKIDLNSLFNGELTLESIDQLMEQLADEQVRLKEERKRKEARLESAKKEAVNKRGEAEKAQIEVENKKTLTANLKQVSESVEEELKKAKKAEMEAAEALRKAQEELKLREAEMEAASNDLATAKENLEITQQHLASAEEDEKNAREIANTKEEEANRAQVKVQKLESELSGKVNVQVPIMGASGTSTRSTKIDQDKLEKKFDAAGIDINKFIKNGSLDASSAELKDNKKLILDAEKETKKEDKQKAKEEKKEDRKNTLNSKYAELQARKFDLEDQIQNATPTYTTSYDEKYYQSLKDLNKVNKQMKRTEAMLERMNNDNVAVNGGNIVGKIKDLGMKLYDSFIMKIHSIGEKITDTLSNGRSK